jgi:predicted metal-binding membrane protein
MDIRQLLKLLVALLVTASLTLAPLATPAAAEHLLSSAGVQMAPMADDHDIADMDMADMMADMPCCPDKQKSPACQDCPLVAICMMMQVLLAGPSASPLGVNRRLGEQLHPLDDIIADGLARPPPDHPPRTLA